MMGRNSEIQENSSIFETVNFSDGWTMNIAKLKMIYQSGDICE